MIIIYIYIPFVSTVCVCVCVFCIIIDVGVAIIISSASTFSSNILLVQCIWLLLCWLDGLFQRTRQFVFYFNFFDGVGNRFQISQRSSPQNERRKTTNICIWRSVRRAPKIIFFFCVFLFLFSSVSWQKWFMHSSLEGWNFRNYKKQNSFDPNLFFDQDECAIRWWFWCATNSSIILRANTFHKRSN